ncbi:MAG: hypothetical protein IPL72_16850 [Sulfuritalea sp.]|nr:hypothetical protein [Sulfuritalea sp.]
MKPRSACYFPRWAYEMRLILFIAITSLFASGCMTLPRYKDAEPRYVGAAPTKSLNAPLVILLEPVIVGKRFDEVVCDNVVGAFWNPEEAKQIGFTQNYGEILPKILPLVALEASLGRNIGVGRVASGQSSLDFDRIKIDSRIMVPFGTYISRNVEQALSVTSGDAKVCFDAACLEEQRRRFPAYKLATVRFTKLRVAEDNPNKLTLIAEGLVLIDEQGRRRDIPVKYEIIDRSISSEGYTHASFLRVMDKTANELSSAIAEQLANAVQ